MKQGWTFRCYPTPEQEQFLARTLGCCRFVYNWALGERTRAYQAGERMTYRGSSAALTLLKKQPERAWLNDVSSVPLQQSLRHLQTAFVNFYEKRSAYPSFKKKGGHEAAEFTRSAFVFEVENHRLLLAKLGRLDVKWSRSVDQIPTTVTVMRKPSGRWFVCLVVDVAVPALPKTGAEVGIDFGVSRLATLSTKERIPNPKHAAKQARRLAWAQKQLAKKKKGSERRHLAKRRVARIHETIQNCRKDTMEKLSTVLVRRFDTIYIEDLNLRGMVQNHALARSLSDAGIGLAIQTIERKAAMYGKKVVRVDRWFPSSKLCSHCGFLLSELPLSIREWTCPKCGSVHDRDLNAARNILAVGQTVTAHGAGVRAASPSGLEAILL